MLVQYQSTVEILSIVLALLNRLTKFVDLALFGSIAYRVDIGSDANALIGRKETIFEVLLERI